MRQKLVLILALAAIAMLGVNPTFSAINVNLDGVKIGEETLITGQHNLQGWGPQEPRRSGGGGWGEALIEFGTLDACRTMFAGGESDDETGRSAYVTLDGKGSARTIWITHLDGIADDSFDVYAQREGEAWIYIGSYAWSGDTAEWWETTDFDLYAAFSAADIGVGLGKPLTVKLVATAPAWDWQHIYGQVGIHEIILVGNGQAGY